MDKYQPLIPSYLPALTLRQSKTAVFVESTAGTAPVLPSVGGRE